MLNCFYWQCLAPFAKAKVLNNRSPVALLLIAMHVNVLSLKLGLVEYFLACGHTCNYEEFIE